VLIGLPGLSPHYQIALTREGALDTMTVEVELAPDAPKGVADLTRKSKEVQHHELSPNFGDGRGQAAAA
jgi:phenylacetate-CoA ligase